MKTFVSHVSRNQPEELALNEIVQQFWRIESEGNQPDSKASSSLQKNISK